MLIDFCRCDITTKFEHKRKRYQEEMDHLTERIRIVEESDSMKNFRLAIDGEWIMQTFGLKPSKTVGLIKSAVLEDVLDGKIKNTFEECSAKAHDEFKKIQS